MTKTLRLRPPHANPEDAALDRGPLLAESVLASLHSVHGTFSLSVAFRDGKVALYASADAHTLPVIRQQLYAQYPEAEQDEVELEEPGDCLTRELSLESSELLPIKTYPAFVDEQTRRLVDPLAGIVAALDGEPAARVEIILTPAHHFRRRARSALPILGQKRAHRWHAYGKFLTRIRLARGWRRWAWYPVTLLLCARKTEEEHPEAEAKLDQPLFHASIRLTCSGTTIMAMCKLNDLAAAFKTFALPHSNGFSVGAIQEGRRKPKRSFLLSAQEVATLWHVLGPLNRAASFDWLLSKKLEIPTNLPSEGITIGDAVFRGKTKRFGILQEDRRRHMYVVGRTGCGKSTLLLNLISADIRAGNGVVVIDPHGDLVDSALQAVPKNRLNDVIIFNPADEDFPIAFNVLQCEPHQRQLAVSGVLSVFKKMWPGLWSSRQEHITRNCLMSLMATKNETLLGLPRLFVDEQYRRKIVSQVTDVSVQQFWKEYQGWTERYRAEAVAPVENKIGSLMSIPILRAILGQPALKLDLRHAIDTRKVILVNLASGRIGEDCAAFIGGLLITRIQLAGMSRVDIPQTERVDCQVYVDEFQNYCTDAFATLLSEARKFSIGLTLAHQYLGQLVTPDGTTKVQDAIFGNIGSLASFTVGPDDAEILSRQFESLISPRDLIGLPRYEAFMKLLVQGTSTKPFTLHSLPPPHLPFDKERIETVRKLSRSRYAERRDRVEAGIQRWMEQGGRKDTTKKARRQA